MNFICSVPAIRLLVNNSYCGVEPGSYEEAYLVAVTSIPGEPLYFTVHLESGALWQRLPIEALAHGKSICHLYSTAELQPFSCLQGDIQVIEYAHLKNYQCEVPSLGLMGTYLFTVDVVGAGLASDPVQYKTHNIVALSNGQICAMPNNMLIFKDNYFTNKDDTPKYKRMDKKYYAGG